MENNFVKYDGFAGVPIGRNIYQLRKLRKLTQEDLANQLHVSCQAVSKWETGLSLPDTLILPQIAAALETGIDTLMGFVSKKKDAPYESIYREEEY